MKKTIILLIVVWSLWVVLAYKVGYDNGRKLGWKEGCDSMISFVIKDCNDDYFGMVVNAWHENRKSQ